MSYLSSLRLHFSGQFVAAPSTVNNDVTHYNNATFHPDFQLPETPTADNGWWNPMGDHRFTLSCQITGGRYLDGSAIPATDPVLGLLVRSKDLPPAKIVDLDPQQQMVSMIFGLELTVGAATGTPALRGRLAPAAFTDIWQRGTTGENDERASAMYQSVLESLTFGAPGASRFLTELQAAATDGLLSIKFNLDGYSMTRGSAGFTKGRLVGTIGPATAAEPRHYVVGRHFNRVLFNDNWPFPFPSIRPTRGINYCVAVLDEANARIRIDLGNAISTAPSGKNAADMGQLTLICGAGSATPVTIGEIPYRTPGWYEATAGIVDLPIGRALTAGELAAVSGKPLSLVLTPATGPSVIAAAEDAQGRHLRADDFVARLNPGDPFPVALRASVFGKPLAGVQIDLGFGAQFLFGGPQPETGVPEAAVSIPPSVTTDELGTAVAVIQCTAPGKPRQYIDGQVYRVDYRLRGAGQLNRSDFLSLLVWDDFAPDEPPTWLGSMKAILEQYANLYPVMKQFVDMASYEDVSANRERIIQLLRLPPTDSRYMPVSRDLSKAKSDAMIRWLENTGADGMPLLGAVPPGPERLTAEADDPASRHLGKAAFAEWLMRERDRLPRRTWSQEPGSENERPQ